MFRRSVFRMAGVAMAVVALSGCSSTATPSPASTNPAPAQSATPATGGEADLSALVAAAKAEGQLNVIALPHDWCNDGEVIESFKAKYGLTVNEINPDAASGDEIEAIKANKTNKGPQAPDVLDFGLSFGISAKAEGLLALYKVSTWGTMAGVKDPDGYWYGNIYGVLAFEVNTSIVKNVPQDWADLLKPEYKGQVALAGDPRVDNRAIQAVYGAALANGGSLDNAEPGLAFFKQLNDAGNFVPAIANAGTIDQGATPIVIRWTYLALTHRDQAAGNPPITVVVPKSGKFAAQYVEAISAYAPHPNAAKLWIEFLYSDEGQNLWLKGYCTPVRFDDMKARGAIPADVLAKLPDTSGVAFPTLEQLQAATKLITEKWDSVVGVNVK